jgi:signal transduction histidine kinase
LLDSYGLCKALEAYFHDQPFGTIATDIRLVDVPAFNINAQADVFRLIQEITHNTIKHAAANEFSIQLVVIDGWLLIDTVDDGKGFNYHPVFQKHLGSGIRNIETRLHNIQAEYRIITSPGRGTRYHISVPLHLNPTQNEKANDQDHYRG